MVIPDPEDNTDGDPSLDLPRSVRYARVGVGLILLSGILWFSMFAVPFLPLTTAEKAIVVGALFLGVQFAWWSGAALAGPRVVRKLTGWFRR